MARNLATESRPDGDGGEPGVLRLRRAAPSEAARVTRAEVNLAHVRHNLRELAACMAADAQAASRPPAQIWAVLKADGYGHGASAIGVSLEQAGADGLCVALLEEGIELREAGVRCPILVMGGYYGRYRDGIEALLGHRLTPVVYDAAQIEAIAAASQYLQLARQVGVHLKVDTGMGRLGALPGELPTLARAFSQHPEVRLDGLMTHLACAEAPDFGVSERQLALFERATATLREASLCPLVRHAANSAAALRMPSAQLDIVRPGIAIYGVHPAPEVTTRSARLPRLKPAMRVLSEVVALRELSPGQALGYGHSWTAKRSSRIATIALGYGDGLDRALSNRGEVLVSGRRAPIVGTISMDLTMIDVTEIPGVRVRDEVVVMGQQRGRHGQDEISAGEIAAAVGRIPWESLTAISRRVPRFYRQP